MAGEPANLQLNHVASDDNKESQKDLQNDSDIRPEKLSLDPKRKLLVLCLGGLLVNRYHVNLWDKVPRLRPDMHDRKFKVFKRPFATEFMGFCLGRFEVGIWSGTTQRNTYATLKCVAGAEMRSKLAFVWGQEECIDSGIECLTQRQKPLFLKDLRLLWDKKYLDLPWRRGQYNPSNTLLVCVDPPTSLLNPPYTAIFPPPYKRHDTMDTFLGPGSELRGYLKGVADAISVPSYVKEHPFGQPAITPSHPDWYHYANVCKFSKEERKSTTNRSFSMKMDQPLFLQPNPSPGCQLEQASPTAFAPYSNFYPGFQIKKPDPFPHPLLKPQNRSWQQEIPSPYPEIPTPPNRFWQQQLPPPHPKIPAAPFSRRNNHHAIRGSHAPATTLYLKSRFFDRNHRFFSRLQSTHHRLYSQRRPKPLRWPSVSKRSGSSTPVKSVQENGGVTPL